MAENIYLKIDPLKGNSVEKDHKDWCVVHSFECQVENELMVTPDANFRFLVVNKVIDGATPDLLQQCANGKRIAKLELDVCRLAGDSNVVLFKYEMENVRVVSVMPNAGSPTENTESVVNEIVKFAYNTIVCTTNPIDSSGSPSTAGPKGWNVNTKEAI